MKDVKFMSATEKKKVLSHWERFLESNCAREKFTKLLYHHLINHCSFIAHYDINGFYSTYFEEGEDTVRFLSQFDSSNGTPKSVEYGGTIWYRDPDYNDINSAMCEVARKFIPYLTQLAHQKQKNTDVIRAESLLAKHGLKANIVFDIPSEG